MSSEWNRHKVYDIIDLISGGTPKTSVPEYWSGNIPWLSVADFNTGYRWVNKADKTITERGVSESSTVVLEKGDLIISARGTVGALAQITKPMAFNQSCYGIRGKQGISDVDFLYYALGEAVTELKQVAHGGVFDTITRETFKIIELNLPPLSEQRAIAQLLGVLDKRIALFRETNTTLEAIAQALFKSWFVDFDPVRAKQEGREPEGMDADTAALFPDSFEESELGLVPKGWKIGKVENLLDLAYGKALKASDRIQGDIPVYGSGGITGSHNEPLVIGPSVIVGRKGTVGSLYWEDFPFFPIDTVFYVKPKVPLTYCFYQLNILGLEGMNTDGAVPGLNRNNVYRLPVIVPENSLSDRFNSIVLPLRKKIHTNLTHAKALVSLRDTLLPRLISGQLRIPEAEALIEETSA